MSYKVIQGHTRSRYSGKHLSAHSIIHRKTLSTDKHTIVLYCVIQSQKNVPQVLIAFTLLMLLLSLLFVTVSYYKLH